MDDGSLLDRYARHGDEDAFRELVQRHLNFVYASALRQVGGDAQFAQDVAQMVFTDLARKATALTRHPALTGWLFTSTRFAAAKLVRRERLRKAREEKAHAMQQILERDSGIPRWEELRLVLDETLAELKSADREAVLLRFFASCGYAEVGARLRISEDAARMRVDRSLEELRTRLARRGLTSTATALGGVLTKHAVAAAPNGLSTAIATSALAGVTGGGTLSSIFMSITKLQVGIASMVVIAGATGIALEARTNATLRQELAAIQTENQDVPALRAENSRRTMNLAEVDGLRRDGAALNQVGDDASALKGRLAALAQAQAAKSEGEKTGMLDGAPVYEIAAADMKPKITTPPKPVYPAALKKAGVAGDATLDFIIDAKGNVRNATVIGSSQKEFEEPALAAINLAKYAPAAKDGQPVHVHVQMTMRFTTDKNESKHGAH